MGRIKKELFELNSKTGEIVFDHCSYYEDSIILKFLNYKFQNKDSDRSNREKLIDLFKYDQMLSQETIIHSENFHLLDDYDNDWQKQVIYFNILQEEINNLFSNITMTEKFNTSFISYGCFQSLDSEINNLGGLKYELVFGNLHLKWDKNIKSFRQILFRSLVTFFAGNKNVLNSLSRCQNEECKKYYFNKKNNPKFCTPIHGKIAYDKSRDQSKRHGIESTQSQYARYQKLDDKYKK